MIKDDVDDVDDDDYDDDDVGAMDDVTVGCAVGFRGESCRT